MPSLIDLLVMVVIWLLMLVIANFAIVTFQFNTSFREQRGLTLLDYITRVQHFICYRNFFEPVITGQLPTTETMVLKCVTTIQRVSSEA